ncbi:MAG TPA: extracellular solute-binding protein [Clostridiaceae bacterium]|nr:extracellular solute-binding protein [Clostridiaceae bacterium]
MLKRIVSILCILVMLTALFVGCANNAEKDQTKTDKNMSKEEKNSEENKEPKEVTLSYVSWMTKGEDKPFMKAFMDENPNIKIQDEALDGTDYDKLLKVRLLSGDAPDVMLLQWAQYKKYVTEGHLMDVADEPGMALLAKKETMDEVFTVDGKKYGFPINANGGPLPVYYNKKYFDKLGITPPKTMEEFYQVCEKIKADGVEPIVFGGKDGWPTEFFFRFRQYTGLLDKYPEWGLALYNGELKPSEFFKKEFEMCEEFVNKGYIGKASLTLTWPQSVPYFIEGRAAMLPQGPWVVGLPEVAEADPEKFELACFTAPVDPYADGKKYSMSEVDRLIAVSSKTEYPEEAKKLFNWFISPENLRKYLESQSLTTFLDLEYNVAPVLQEHFKTLSSDEYVLLFSQKAQMPSGFIADAFWNGFQNILAGSTSADELKKLDAEFEKTKDAIVVSE